jgi:uncharacterized membrane protein
MAVYVLALLIGVVAGLRSMMAPAAVSFGARLGYLRLMQTPLSFLGGAMAPYVLLVCALGELVADQLPKTPSRKTPLAFGARIVTGGLSGAAIGASGGSLVPGLVFGIVGAVLGTLGGAAARARLARALGKDMPAALLEDVVAVGSAVLIVGLSP